MSVGDVRSDIDLLSQAINMAEVVACIAGSIPDHLHLQGENSCNAIHMPSKTFITLQDLVGFILHGKQMMLSAMQNKAAKSVK